MKLWASTSIHYDRISLAQAQLLTLIVVSSTRHIRNPSTTPIIEWTTLHFTLNSRPYFTVTFSNTMPMDHIQVHKWLISRQSACIGYIKASTSITGPCLPNYCTDQLRTRAKQYGDDDDQNAQVTLRARNTKTNFHSTMLTIVIITTHIYSTVIYQYRITWPIQINLWIQTVYLQILHIGIVKKVLPCNYILIQIIKVPH